ncbi:MAG: hypothetical protein QOH88_861 [Verrucomicrobiota bacterium]|jgi:hypothetical protein
MPQQSKRSTLPKDGKRKRSTNAADRVRRYNDFLVEALDEYCEHNHPNWRAERLLQFLELSVGVLRDHIESPKAQHITWESPWVTWNFPVLWDWIAWKRRDRVGAGFAYGTLTEANTARRTVALQAIASILTNFTFYQTLQDFTKGAGFERTRDDYKPILAPEAAQLLQRVRGRRAKLQVLEALFRPFSMGAVPIEVADDELREGKKLSKAILKRLEAANKSIDLPSIDLTATLDDTHRADISLIFQIHPLVVETQRRKAYYPMTVGFVIVPSETGAVEDLGALLSEPWLNPDNWSSDDQDALWKTVLGELKRLQESFASEQGEVQTDAVVTINAAVRIPAGASHPQISQEAVEQMLKTFQASGDVIELSYQISPQTPQLSTSARLGFVELLGKVEHAASADQKGRALEQLVETLLASVPGFEVKQRIRTETEEVDLVVLQRGDEPRWKRDAPLLLIECKNWSSRCGKNELVQFKEKLANRRGRSTLGFIVSWNGFAETVTKELLRGSREDMLIVPLTGDQIREAAHAGTILPTLQAAWDNAVMT